MLECGKGMVWNEWRACVGHVIGKTVRHRADPLFQNSFDPTVFLPFCYAIPISRSAR